MASNHTPNFNLSQWEKTDKVQMEDFNADNAKIDAGLPPLRGADRVRDGGGGARAAGA